MQELMYLRPGNLFKEFAVEEQQQTVLDTGRAVTEYVPVDGPGLKGTLSVARPDEAARFSQDGHPVTHTIVQGGRPKAKANDRLRWGGRLYLVVGVDECGSIGASTIYYVEERKDAR